MKTIDEQKLATDLAYRFDYLAEFIGFSKDDANAIQAFAPHLGPNIPKLVDRTYERLLQYDATARHFLPQQHGFDGKSPGSLEKLAKDDPQIKFRKDHLNRYFLQLIGRSYDDKMVLYLDTVGKMHTSLAGNKEIEVPLVQMNALMGLLSDLIMELVLDSNLEQDSKSKTLRAFQRLFWIQNDLISRHYIK